MKRLESLDVLRGIDMMLIMGFSAVVLSLCKLCGWGVDCSFAQQFRHVEWNGLHLEDMIFPLFLFLAGASWPFSLASQRERGRTTREIVFKCVRRAAVLVALGLVYNGLLSGQLRLGSVLGRIGVAWLIGALLSLKFRRPTLAALAVAIPIAYWLLLYFVPAPDANGAGPFTLAGNLSGWCDRTFRPGILSPYPGVMDNQSMLGYIPAVGTALFGILAGSVLQARDAIGVGRRFALLYGAAAGLVALGLLIAFGFGEMSMPINKKLWSASFTFIVGGASVALLATAHLAVDVCGWTRGTLFFKVIGMNAIAVYLARKFIPFDVISQRVFGGLAKLLPAAGGELLLAVGSLALSWALLWFLYRHKIFFKV